MREMLTVVDRGDRVAWPRGLRYKEIALWLAEGTHIAPARPGSEGVEPACHETVTVLLPMMTRSPQRAAVCCSVACSRGVADAPGGLRRCVEQLICPWCANLRIAAADASSRAWKRVARGLAGSAWTCTSRRPLDTLNPGDQRG